MAESRQKTRQNAILQILSSRPQNAEFEIDEIHQILHDEYQIQISQRTINRDLDKLQEQELITSQGQARATVYFLTAPKKAQYFETNFTERQVQEEFNWDVFNKLKKQEEEIFAKHEQQQICQAINLYRDNILKTSPTLFKKELERLTIEFSWKSSQIEGCTYSVLETEALIRYGRTADGKNIEEANMILNHKQAFDYVFANSQYFERLNEHKIREVHQLLSTNLNFTTGIRSIPVRITGTRYMPLDNEHQITEALEQSCDLINSIEEPVAKALCALSLISYIQAFEDGNKRTARLIANAILLAYEICPLSYRSADKGDYKRALVYFYEQNDLLLIKDLFLKQFLDAANNYF